MAKKKKVQKNRTAKKARDAAKAKRKKQPAAATGQGRFARMVGYTRGEVARAPVYAAYIADGIESGGMGYVLVGREMPDRQIVAGVFLVDAYCLGVKNCFLMRKPAHLFDQALRDEFADHGLQTSSPACARKQVEEAIAYARDLGFEPHRDFSDAVAVLEGIDASACDRTFVFGHEGKPFYIVGPRDSDLTAQRIVAQLHERCGPGNYNYILTGPEGAGIDPNWFEDDNGA